MRALRENCIVLDTSILPKRPNISEVKKFMDEELRIDMSQVIYIQPHNVHNVVYLGMRSNEAASALAAAHHLQHSFVYEGKKIPMPIYVESSAIDVRLHDLPYDMDNVAIINHMNQYGEVIAVSREVWKSYFPGFINGVRVVRMKLTLPIPSYITVDGETTLVSYQNQQKTCRNCGRKAHPKLRCSEVAAATAENEDNEHNTNVVDSNKNNNTNDNNQQPKASCSNTAQWPELPKTKAKNNPAEMKRQRSIDSDTSTNGTKKQNANNSNSDSDSSLISVCPNTEAQHPYGEVGTYAHIEDPEERRALIENDQRQIDAYLAKEAMKKKKKNNVK